MKINQLFGFSIIFLSLLGCAATPQADAEDNAEYAKIAGVESPDDVICVREKVTGSHFSQRVCRTREQIEAQRKADQEQLERVNSTGFVTNSAGAN